MNIEKLIDECYETAKSKGFYTCKECKGKGEYYQKNPDCRNCGSYEMCPTSYEKVCSVPSTCTTCNSTENYRNVPDLLMHTLGEFSEVREAYRGTKRAKLLLYLDKGPKYFEEYIKGTPEEELADSFIIIFSLLGYLEVPQKYVDQYNTIFNIQSLHIPEENIPLGQRLFEVAHTLATGYYNKQIFTGIGQVFILLLTICTELKVDIIPFIEAKMLYNKSRPKYNGKAF